MEAGGGQPAWLVFISFGSSHLAMEFSQREVCQGRQSLSFMRCHMTIVSCSYSFTIIRNGRARCHNPFLFPL